MERKENKRCDSIGKIIDELKANTFTAHWADRLEALTKEPVATVIALNGNTFTQYTKVLPDGEHKLFAAPPAPAVPDGWLKLWDKVLQNYERSEDDDWCVLTLQAREVKDLLAAAPERENGA